MRWSIIKNEKEYDRALKRLEVIFHAKEGTREADELELLALLIEHYEDKHYPIPEPDPIEAIKFRMDQMGYRQSDLAKLLGQKSHASEILNRKRKLTLEMMRKLNKAWGISLETLIKDYRLKRKSAKSIRKTAHTSASSNPRKFRTVPNQGTSQKPARR